MIPPFKFDDSGRTFSCETEKLGKGPEAETWWWIQVSGDANRYAPFRAKASDTKATVRQGVSDFYRNLLEARARPAAPRGNFGGRPKAVPPAPPAESTPTA
ncbi:MAG: hypothetical protein ACT4OZ_12620 [Gemmatimonadota bacterium]